VITKCPLGKCNADHNELDRRIEICLVCMFLCAGFCLRFFGLDASSLRWDETVAVLNADKPLSYLWAWAHTSEVHPPYFHLLIKFMLNVGKSDIVVRLVPATAGVATIYALYAVSRKVFGQYVSLAACAICALHPFMILFSRQVRPYSVYTLLFIVSLYYLIRFVEEEQRGAFWRLIFVNFAMTLLLHALSVVVIAAEVVSMAVLRCFTKAPSVRMIARFVAASAVSFLVVLPSFLVSTKKHLISGSDLATMAKALSVNFGELLFLFTDSEVLKFVLSVYYVVGAVILFKNSLRRFVVFAACVLFPVLFVCIVGYSQFFYSWHFMFMVPIFIILLSLPIARVAEKSKALFVVACVVSVVISPALFTVFCDTIYSKNSHYDGKFYSQEWPSKSVAQELSRLVAPGDMVVFDSDHTFYRLNWYVNQFNLTGFPEFQAISPESGTRTVHYVASSKDSVATRQIAADRYTEMSPYAVSRFQVPNESHFIVEEVPYSRLFSAQFPAFYAESHALENMMINFDRGAKAVATRNNTDTFVEYVLENKSGSGYPQSITGTLSFNNDGVGSIVSLQCRFDDEDFIELGRHLGYVKGSDIPEEEFKYEVIRTTPYKRLLFRANVRCALVSPDYPGGNLKSTALHGLSVNIAPVTFDMMDTKYLSRRIQSTGLKTVEKDGQFAWRWALGSTMETTFVLDEDASVSFLYEFCNFIPNQDVVIYLNGQEIARHMNMPTQKWMKEFISGTVHGPGNKGNNTLRFVFKDWNAKQVQYLTGDNSPYSAAFTKLLFQ